MRIMVVEDEAIVGLEESAILTEAGYTVVGLTSAMEDALRLAENARPELALVDVRLRDGRSGYDLAQELLHRWSILSVIVSGEPPDVATGSPKFSFLPKPFSEEELLAAVSRCAKRQDH